MLRKLKKSALLIIIGEALFWIFSYFSNSDKILGILQDEVF